jgi:hypothetical protein
LLHAQVKLTSSHKTSSRSLLHALGIRTRVQVLQPCRAPLVLVTRPRALRQPCCAPRLLVSGCTRSTSTLPCAASTRLPAATALHLLHRASGCLGMSRGSSRRSSSTTPPRPSSSSTTPPRVQVPRHVARLVTPLVVDYSTARPGASARRVARHAARRRSSSTTSPTPRVRVPRHAARLVTRLVAARRRLLRLRRASGCLGTSRGSSPLIVDYSMHRDFVLWPHWLYFSQTVRGDYLSRGNTGSTSSVPRTATTKSSGRITLVCNHVWPLDLHGRYPQQGRR